MEPRNKAIRPTLTSSEHSRIVRWMKAKDLAEHGKTTALRLMAEMVVSQNLDPTPEQIEAALPRKLEKGEQRKIKEQS